MVGMIAKISEQMEKIPESNKLAYRILFMEVMLYLYVPLLEFLIQVSPLTGLPL